MEVLKRKLVKAGKLEKLRIYTELIELQVKNRDSGYISSYEQSLAIFEDYLGFDEHPPAEVYQMLLKIFNHTFRGIRFLADKASFKSVFKSFSKHENHFTDEIILAKVYSDLNYLFWQHEKLDKALQYGQKSLSCLETCGNSTILTGRYNNIGYIYETMGNFELAEEYYEKGLRYGFEINSDQVKNLAYCGYGRLNLNNSNIKLAVNYFLEALKYFQNQDSEDYMSVCSNLGIAYGMLKQYDESLKYFTPFITDKVKAKSPEMYFTFLLNLANSYHFLGKYQKAETNLFSALEFAHYTKNKEDIAGVLINLGNLEKAQRNLPKALEFYLESRKYIVQDYNIQQDMLADQGIGVVYSLMKDDEKAISYLNSSLMKAKKLNLKYQTIVTYNNLVEIYERQGNYQLALDNYKILKAIELESKDYQFNLDMKLLRKKYDHKEKSMVSHKIKSVDSLISLELAELVNSPLIGTSPIMRDVLYKTQIAAKNGKISVLLTGESGTGKEIIARIIHYSSRRTKNPFISVNCASFSQSLIESSFFGCEKGAYTGAVSRQIGYFEVAHTGTMFLDEIGDMPFDMQSKFLRVIEEQTINRVGSTKNINIDIRLISATNRNIFELTDGNLFRLDLLNRINTLEINIPPLRQRKEDIPLLVDYFLSQLSKEMNLEKPVCTKEAIDLLLSYSYPGNVRELINIIKRSLLFNKKSILDVQNIIFPPQHDQIFLSNSDINSFNLAENERQLIKLVMEKTNGLQVKAAELLGLSPSAFSRRLKKINS